MSTARERGEGLGQRIRTARRQRGLSAQKLAEAIGRSLPTVYVWEQGKVLPSLPDALALVEVLGVDIRWLLTGDKDYRPAASVA